MTRLRLLVACLVSCALLTQAADAQETAKKLTAEQRRELEAKWAEKNAAGGKAFGAGQYGDAARSWQAAPELARQLYPKDEFPDGHANLAASLMFMGLALKSQGKLTEAKPFYVDAIRMRRTLDKGDHPDLALAINNLALLVQAQGKYVEAETLLHEALAMRRRLFQGPHTDVATSLNCLAVLYHDQGRDAEAEPVLRDVLAMLRKVIHGDHVAVAYSLNNLASVLEKQEKYDEARQTYDEALAMGKRLFKGDHVFVAHALLNLGGLHFAQGDFAHAEPLIHDALTMSQRLFKGPHPTTASTLNNLAFLLGAQGKLDESEQRFREALAMNQRLFKGDHRLVAQGFNSLAGCLTEQKKYAEAVALLRESLAMHRRLIQTFASQKSEGETLTFIAAQSSMQNPFLTNAWLLKAAPAEVYAEVWRFKGQVARVYEQRQLQARAARVDEKAAPVLAELSALRRRRAELLTTPEPKERADRQKREGELQDLDGRVAELTRLLPGRLPPLTRSEKLAAASPADLQKALPPDAAVVDFVRFKFREHELTRRSKADTKDDAHYHAFIVTPDHIDWIDLGLAEPIEQVLGTWVNAITSGKEIADDLGARVRASVWAPVRKKLPQTIKAVYLCPDSYLCQLPWCALPGDRSGTILLEDFAVATIPHTPFLLDKLWPPDPLKNAPNEALVVGGIEYGTVPGKSDKAAGWSFLPGTAIEASGVAGAAERSKLPRTHLTGAKASARAILAALPKAKHAHLATHGFFADPSFQSVFQLSAKDYERSLRGERIGRAALSPLVMTGLVFAGANNPQTAGRGIVTGEALIDLDLSGLELAVLSACETGLGDLFVGEGTFDLQRAFHLAGTRDVVASLWKVPDESTAALMAIFYRSLWEKRLSPMESLRQAQLELYRNPGRIAELAVAFRGTVRVGPGAGTDGVIQPNPRGKAHPLLWAAFTLSGPGRSTESRHRDNKSVARFTGYDAGDRPSSTARQNSGMPR